MSGPVVIVTGASSGIGAATAVLFGKHGYRVVLAARRIELLKSIGEKIREGGGEALEIKTDVTDLNQLKNLVDSTLSEYGEIDVLVNNAGMGRLQWLDELRPEEDITAQIEVNLLAAIHLTRFVLPHFLQRGRGHIINVSSAGAWLAVPTYTVYTATKYGLRGFTLSLRRELRETRIRVTGIYPGAVATEFDQHAGVEWEIESATPRWLLLSPEQVAEGILQAVRTGKRKVVLPWVMNLVIWGEIFTPGLIGWFLGRYFHRRGGKSITWGKGG